MVHLFATLLNDKLRHQAGRPERAVDRERRPSTLRSLLVLPTDYGVLALSFALLAAPAVFLGVYGVLLAGTAGYLLLVVRRVCMGTVGDADNGAALAHDRDLSPRELVSWLPLAALTLLAGVWPAVVLAVADPAMHNVLGAFGAIGAGR